MSFAPEIAVSAALRIAVAVELVIVAPQSAMVVARQTAKIVALLIDLPAAPEPAAAFQTVAIVAAMIVEADSTITEYVQQRAVSD